jgi:hypothetical protein
MGRDSAVGIATPYGLDGPGIEFRLGRSFTHPSRLGSSEPEHGVNQPHSSRVEVKDSVE